MLVMWRMWGMWRYNKMTEDAGRWSQAEVRPLRRSGRGPVGVHTHCTLKEAAAAAAAAASSWETAMEDD